MPLTIAICWYVTSAPRLEGGAISAMYMGASIEARPMPMPPKRRWPMKLVITSPNFR